MLSLDQQIGHFHERAVINKLSSSRIRGSGKIGVASTKVMVLKVAKNWPNPFIEHHCPGIFFQGADVDCRTDSVPS